MIQKIIMRLLLVLILVTQMLHGPNKVCQIRNKNNK